MLSFTVTCNHNVLASPFSNYLGSGSDLWKRNTEQDKRLSDKPEWNTWNMNAQVKNLKSMGHRPLLRCLHTVLTYNDVCKTVTTNHRMRFKTFLYLERFWGESWFMKLSSEHSMILNE